MIRYAKAGDRADIIKIWKTSFSDSAEYINEFLDQLGHPGNCLILEKEGEPVSMLFLLPCKIKVSGVLEPAYYIYACATLPDYREKGVMRQLLRFTFEEAVRQNIYALLLIPDGEALFDYYEKMGFQRFFRRYIFEENTQKRCETEEYEYSNLPDIRQELLTEEFSVHWDEKHLLFAIRDFCASGGKILKSGEGYIACSEVEGKTIVKEIAPVNKTDFRISDEYYGMIRFCREEIQTGDSYPYLNWGLD